MSTTNTSLQGASLAMPASVNAIGKPASAAATAAGKTSADGGLGSTFLSLLSQELQNQDPTAPVDSTQMVAQMISLNQLDQLINISQAVTSIVSGTASAPSATAEAAKKTAAVQPANTQAPSASAASAAAAANYQLPFDPNTMLPVNMPNAGTTSTSAVPTVGASASIIK